MKAETNVIAHCPEWMILYQHAYSAVDRINRPQRRDAFGEELAANLVDDVSEQAALYRRPRLQ